MSIPRSTLVAALASAFPLFSLWAMPAVAQAQEAETAPPVEVTVYGERPNALTTPDTVLDGDELQRQRGASLGATLSNQLGVSTTSFGAGASTPVLRGLTGPRVQVLENGLTLGDVTSVSADHANGLPIDNARQIEILRGPATLQYGSGSSGGLVNVLNDRILDSVPVQPTATIDTSYDTASQGKSGALTVDTGAGPWALHADTAISNANNYRIPGYAEQGGPGADWRINPGDPVNISSRGKLPNSFNQLNNVGLGASYIGTDGYTGLSFEHINHFYGTPTADGSFIYQQQNRGDLVKLLRNPFDGFSEIKLSASYVQYEHTEYDTTKTPQTLWDNKTGELRLDLKHDPILGMSGTTGVQINVSRLDAKDLGSGNSAILPSTLTSNYALFWVGNGRYGNVDTSLGARAGFVTTNPDHNTTYAGADDADFVNGSATQPELRSRNFFLFSYAAGALWRFYPQYGAGVTYTVSQRAPSTSELYAFGAHDASATYDVGNANLQRETSHNLEFTLQKNAGTLQGKLNAYVNQFSNYIYGRYTGAYSAANDNYSVVAQQQADARIAGMEGELTWNWQRNGYGARLFGDYSEGVFNSGGFLPLQPAPRLGLEVAWQQERWYAGTSYTHGFRQDKLASFETGPAGDYNLLNANFSWSERVNGSRWTAYLSFKNLLNEDIRYATTPMAVRLYAPQPGRSVVIGLKVAL